MELTDIWMVVGALTLFAGICIFAIVYSLKLHRKLVVQFKQLSENLGLELTEHPPAFKGLMQRPPTLYGHYKQRELSIYAYGYGLDNTRQTDTAIRLQTKAPKDLKISFGQQGALSKLGQAGRLKKCATGNSIFDQKFSLRSNDTIVSKTFGNESIQMLFVDRWNKQSGFLTLEDQLMTYVQFGLPYTETDRKQIEAMVELCCQLGDELDALA